MSNLAKRFYAYSERTFHLSEMFRRVKDGRKDPAHALDALLWKGIAAITTGLDSFNQWEEAIQAGDLDRIVSRTRPSADTFSRAFGVCERTGLLDCHDAMVKKVRYNKALEDVKVEGYRVVAIDGSGTFSTRSRRLGRWAHHRRGVHGEKLDEEIYLEQVLAVSYVGGTGPTVLLALERIPPGQGETTVARKTLQRLYARQCRYCDVITVDANFAKGPVLNAVLDQKKEFVVRVKQEHYGIIQDVAGLFDGAAPDETHQNVKVRDASRRFVYDLEIWDEEGLMSWDTVNAPLRCLRIRQTRKEVNAQGEVTDVRTVTTHLVTSATKATMPALTVWRIAQVRWDVENTGFHFLKHHFKLEHAYSYHPHVIEVMLTLFMMAFNLFMLFVHRNLRTMENKRSTFKGLMRRIYTGIVTLTEPIWKFRTDTA